MIGSGRISKKYVEFKKSQVFILTNLNEQYLYVKPFILSVKQSLRRNDVNSGHCVPPQEQRGKDLVCNVFLFRRETRREGKIMSDKLNLRQNYHKTD
mgnify:CR=1 FL=1|jgi:hypothetical protein